MKFQIKISSAQIARWWHSRKVWMFNTINYLGKPGNVSKSKIKGPCRYHPRCVSFADIACRFFLRSLLSLPLCLAVVPLLLFFLLHMFSYFLGSLKTSRFMLFFCMAFYVYCCLITRFKVLYGFSWDLKIDTINKQSHLFRILQKAICG